MTEVDFMTLAIEKNANTKNKFKIYLKSQQMELHSIKKNES